MADWRPAAAAICAFALCACTENTDEARQVKRTAESFVPAAEDYFAAMDQTQKGPPALTKEQIMGRNTWLVWSGGNDRLWNVIAMRSEGALDLLKTATGAGVQKRIDEAYEKAVAEAVRNHAPPPPAPAGDRRKRWQYLGLVHEPCYETATGPDASRFGLWLDRRKHTPECSMPDPFEDEAKYPGVKIGARGRPGFPAGSYYGYASGIVGLRLFPNPDFDEKAQKDWDAERYYSVDEKDAQYQRSVIRPYRVGMTCAFCHVGPNPLKPPADPENPRWENLSSNVGAQYFRVGRVFDWKADPKTFLFQLFNASRAGTLDTSFISTDNVNNPRTMNAVYALGARLAQGRRWGKETLAGGALGHKQLAGFFDPPDTAWSPHVLKDGADSAGALAALNRVYANIGVFSEETLDRASAIIGLRLQAPFEIATARRNSAYWEATEAQTPNVAQFFLKISGAHKLGEAPGGAPYLEADPKVLEKGKLLFAERCAQCHSSKLPPGSPLDAAGGCSGRNYLSCLERYWKWTASEDFKSQMKRIVLDEHFLEGNFLSTDLRIPVTVLQTNACSPLAANATAGHVWDNFSSYDYKDLPAVGALTVHHPLTGKPWRYALPAGGRGYTRPPSLVSLWSTAPFLLNNSVGRLVAGAPGQAADQVNPAPSVEERMRVFDASIEQLLWPEKRETDALLGSLGVAKIERTTQMSDLHLSVGFLPGPLQRLWPALAWGFGKYGVTGEGLDIRYIPAGTPVNLIANLELRSQEPSVLKRLAHDLRVLGLIAAAMTHFRDLPPNPNDEQARNAFAPLVDPLLELNSCPDFEVNRGHYFGTSLADGDKRALIAFLKTF